MTFRWGILGAANFARQQMGPAIHAALGNDLVALSTSSPEKAAGFEAISPNLIVYPDYDALLASDEIDAVYVPLPNHIHVEWTLKALEAGKHVLCEKPIALKAEDIDRVIAARDETGLMAAEAFMITHHPQWHKTRDLIADGAIGELRHVDVAFSFNNPDPANIRNKPETGGGSIPDIGVYAYGAARFATGAEPVDLAARLKRENGVDTFAHVTGEMDGPTGRFTYSGITSTRMANRQDMVFHGSDGTITLHAPFNANVFGEAQVLLRRGDETTVYRYPGVNQYVLQVEAFARAAQTGADYDCPLEFSKGTQAMMDKVFEVAVDMN
ncbi:Gfo/Idh/MocA family protein [Maritimibacter dapengensis]|uniref:Gfo/Idh/MocA family oxidoreductase n=1 Tax=Maritimibacter dapengensis TaxID=2836868 RepID=A0ABS6SZB2_9RHOB|nr:Gfo/Idh/MocA family oxidoreductase [Maritimibacter dapengensis]MBV7378321.1 Gfo/Idh/MocA family oxidoreductase [Maritimibacter dapengensis]